MFFLIFKYEEICKISKEICRKYVADKNKYHGNIKNNGGNMKKYSSPSPYIKANGTWARGKNSDFSCCETLKIPGSPLIGHDEVLIEAPSEARSELSCSSFPPMHGTWKKYHPLNLAQDWKDMIHDLYYLLVKSFLIY